jgi:protein gp37
MSPTTIEWTDESWNPIAAFDRETGKRGHICARVSPGCLHCYAARRNRWLGNGHDYRVPELAKVDIRLLDDVLVQPLSWQRPRMVFVCSMTDLFLDEHPDEWIAQVFAIMALARRHTFQVLTKRARRMHELVASHFFRELVAAYVEHYAMELTDPHDRRRNDLRATAPDIDGPDWPLPNAWLGVSAENEEYAEERLPWLLSIPDVLMPWVSYEPALGPIDWRRWMDFPGCNAPPAWVVPGGESGPGARAFQLEWGYAAIAAGRRYGVKVFMKQLGARPTLAGNTLRLRDSKGGDMSEWPEDLRVREWPTSTIAEPAGAL